MARNLFKKTAVRAGVLGLLLVTGCEGAGKDTNMATIMGVGDDQNLIESPAPKKPKPTPTPTPPPLPSPTPAADNAILRRNVAFDAIRSKGIAQVYQHEIDPAIATLNSAYRLRPNDKSIALWLDAIHKGQDLSKKTAASPGPGAFQNPQPGQPGAAAVPGAQPAIPPAGAPAVPPAAPGAVPSATQIDPRLVF